MMTGLFIYPDFPVGATAACTSADDLCALLEKAERFVVHVMPINSPEGARERNALFRTFFCNVRYETLFSHFLFDGYRDPSHMRKSLDLYQNTFRSFEIKPLLEAVLTEWKLKHNIERHCSKGQLGDFFSMLKKEKEFNRARLIIDNVFEQFAIKPIAYVVYEMLRSEYVCQAGDTFGHSYFTRRVALPWEGRKLDLDHVRLAADTLKRRIHGALDLLAGRDEAYQNPFKAYFDKHVGSKPGYWMLLADLKSKFGETAGEQLLIDLFKLDGIKGSTKSKLALPVAESPALVMAGAGACAAIEDVKPTSP